MKTVFEHIEHIKGKPHHVRERVAFAVAGGITALIALVWLTGSLATGAFAIEGSSFGAQPVAPASDTSVGSGLAGAAAALPNVSENTPARIEIIDAVVSGQPKKPVEQTTLPF